MDRSESLPAGHDLPLRPPPMEQVTSDEALALLAEQVPDVALITLDPDGRITGWNLGAETMFGYTATEISGEHIARLFSAEDGGAGRPDRELAESRRAGRTADERRAVRKDGASLWISAVTTPLWGEHHLLRGFVQIIRDRTEMRQTAEQLRQERERYRDLIMQAPAGIAIVRGPDHIYELANPLYERIAGHRAEDLLGKPGRESRPELAEQGIWDVYDRVYATGESFVGIEFPVELDQNGDGRLERCFFNVVGQPVRNENGQVDGILIHAMDVTQQVQARQRTEELARQLEIERARLEIGQQAGNIGTFEWDLRTDELLWTPELEALYGFCPGEFGNRYEDWAARVHPDDLPGTQEAVDLALGQHTDLHIEFRIVRKDGGVAWMAAEGKLYDGESGSPERMIGVNIDITDRKQAEANLHFLSDASHILSSSLDYETTLDAVARLAVPHIGDWCSIDMLDSAANLQLVALAHKDPEKAQWGRELRKHSPVDMSLRRGLPEVLRTGRSELYSLITDEMLVATARDERELELLRSLGFTSAIIAPIHSRGVPIGAITLVTTESRRRYTEADLAMAEELTNRASLAIDNALLYRESQIAISVRDEFISMASHELRTPVTSLKIYAQVMRRQAQRRGDSAQSDQLAKMERQIDRLTNLISDLLDVSRIQAGKLEYRLDEFDVTALVEEIAESLKSTDETHTISVVQPGPVVIWGDRERIGQVVTNLLTNAIKYSPRAKRVIVEITRSDDTITIAVRDFGIGIESHYHEHIFDRFYQVSDPEERTYPGLGMGLYISREIARRHGGDIRVQSARGVGSTFSLIVPAAQMATARTG